ncbi:MAG: hypothetical protein M3Y26_00390 [Actinomycetota bacterium]|nr:hypothetical protein [Actinomycetota bacterium]
MSPPSNWLDDYFGPASLLQDGAALPKRPTVNVVSPLVATDDVVNNRTNLTVPGGGTLAADGSGNSNISGEVNNTSNANVNRHEYNVNTLLGGAAATIIKTIAVPTTTACSVRGIVRCMNSNVGVYGEWEINCFVRNVAGVLTIHGTPVTQKQNSTTLALTFTAVGTNLIVTATNEAVATRRWTGEIYVAAATY